MQIEALNGTYNSNTYVVGNLSAVIIIDSGAPLAAVKNAVGERAVRGILVTHEHFDHLTNCADYARVFGAPIYGTREVLDNLKYYRAELPSEEEAGVVYPIAQLDDTVEFRVIADEQPLTLGEFSVQPLICQGHSAGSLVYQIDDNLFTGDLLFARGVGNVYMTRGKEYLIQSLARVQTLPFNQAYHGHGASSDRAGQLKNIQVWLKWLSR